MKFLLYILLFYAAFSQRLYADELPDTIVIPDYIQFPGDETLDDYELIDASVPILGIPQIGVEQMYRFVCSQNPDFDREIAEAFYNIGYLYGVRGDIALCQAILETGWFMFADGTAVTPDQHNYCGLGVTKRGLKGNSFMTIEDGVTAQIQHLYAYASTHPVPRGCPIIDPRFFMVNRGSAKTWGDLNMRWAMNNNYGQHIIALFTNMAEFTE